MQLASCCSHAGKLATRKNFFTEKKPQHFSRPLKYNNAGTQLATTAMTGGHATATSYCEAARLQSVALAAHAASVASRNSLLQCPIGDGEPQCPFRKLQPQVCSRQLPPRAHRRKPRHRRKKHSARPKPRPQKRICKSKIVVIPLSGVRGAGSEYSNPGASVLAVFGKLKPVRCV